MIVDFREDVLGTRDKLADELDTFTGGLDALCKRSSSSHKGADVPISTKMKVFNSLDVNLMLVFLWLGCLTLDLPVIEKDILLGAQKDTFGYLSEFQATTQLLSQAS